MIHLKTAYEIGEIPHAEHPLPQARREHWLCLNGKWELAKETVSGTVVPAGDILVPFSPETLNSGIPAPFVLLPGEKLHYARRFFVDDKAISCRTVLHFGAVDSEATVRINGSEAGSHRGGYTPFSFDISHLLVPGENRIEVEVTDEGTRNGGAKGKQNDDRGGIWYTPQSGIWQTVWLEFMPTVYIRDLRITPNAADRTVHIAASSGGEKQSIKVFDGEKEILAATFTESVLLSYDFSLWSPEHPRLYDFTLENESGDLLHSYFAIRSLDMCRDGAGKARLCLNGEPYFFNGLLDQGYWSDGMLTSPSDKAMADEIQLMKDMGFNTLRKHIKIEPMRWYYHCDRLGMAVWQDFVNGGGAYKFSHIAALPFLGIQHRDDDYAFFAREDAAGRAEYEAAMVETVNALYNTPSVCLWVPFNEGWGQFDSERITKKLRELDSTRLIDAVSGWHDQGVKKTTMRSLHTYYTPLKVPHDPRPVVLSEFGGYSMQTPGHVYDPDKLFGYKKFKTQAELAAALEKLYLKKLLPLIKKGLCAAIYTQVSDVEEEINGLVTYDRRVVKLPVDFLRRLNDALMEKAAEIKGSAPYTD